MGCVACAGAGCAPVLPLPSAFPRALLTSLLRFRSPPARLCQLPWPHAAPPGCCQHPSLAVADSRCGRAGSCLRCGGQRFGGSCCWCSAAAAGAAAAAASATVAAAPLVWGGMCCSSRPAGGQGPLLLYCTHHAPARPALSLPVHPPVHPPARPAAAALCSGLVIVAVALQQVELRLPLVFFGSRRAQVRCAGIARRCRRPLPPGRLAGLRRPAASSPRLPVAQRCAGTALSACGCALS